MNRVQSPESNRPKTAKEDKNNEEEKNACHIRRIRLPSDLLVEQASPDDMPRKGDRRIDSNLDVRPYPKVKTSSRHVNGSRRPSLPLLSCPKSLLSLPLPPELEL